MAWPASPLTSYVAHSTPVIKAVDLNAFQSGINGIINGTYSLAAFVVDGTGGMVVSPLAGTGTVSALLCATGFPNPSVAAGQFGVAGVPIGFAYVVGGVGLTKGYNVYRVDRHSAGYYSVIFNIVPSTPDENFCLATLRMLTSGGSSIGTILAVGIADGGTPRQGVDIHTYDLAGAPQEAAFFVGCWGE